jgi:FkbM family methyltransferase
MGFLAKAKRFTNRLIHPTGLAIVRRKSRLTEPTFPGALERLQRRAIPVRSIIDIGASDGVWSASMTNVYPDSNYLLIEANPIHKRGLEDFCRRHPRASYVIAAAAAEDGSIFFDNSEPLGGVAACAPLDPNFSIVSATTVDSQVADKTLEPPFLLKLDTHGFEAQILEGAFETLKETAVIVVECYNFKVTSGSLLFDEMCRSLRDKGFRCLDVFDILYRKSDNAFWQADFLFVRGDRGEFSDNGFD